MLHYFSLISYIRLRTQKHIVFISSTMKTPGEYSVNEVCIWLNAIGLGAMVDGFRENSVDGNMLIGLTLDDLTADLGLNNLQAKKLMRDLETTQEMANGGGGGGAGAGRIKELEDENALLRKRVMELTEEVSALTPAPKAAPASVPAPAPAPAPKKKEHTVVREGAKGAVKGATLGAIGGAIAGDAAKGAKMGAAMGGAHGGMRGLRARRR